MLNFWKPLWLATHGVPHGWHGVTFLWIMRQGQPRSEHFFCKWDPRSSTLQVQAVKAGITAINGVLMSVLMGKILVFLHFPPASSVPPPYGQEGIKG